MPTMCVVVKCYNQHSKHLKRSFIIHNRCKLSSEWIAFVSCKNADDLPWQPGSRDYIRFE